jgi:hypothetical protein
MTGLGGSPGVCMAFIDVVEWNDAGNDVFAWKFG